jgi:hypothetical protein
VTQNLNTLLTALYVKIDDEIGGTRWMGRPPLLTDSELVCLAVAQALLGHRSEARWLRFARKHLTGMFPYLPQQSGYDKRLRSALPLVQRMIRELATDNDLWFDNHWIVDSTPVPCGMSRPTVQRSNLAGWAGYGYCASHSRFFWGRCQLGSAVWTAEMITGLMAVGEDGLPRSHRPDASGRWAASPQPVSRLWARHPCRSVRTTYCGPAEPGRWGRSATATAVDPASPSAARTGCGRRRRLFIAGRWT